MLIDGAKTTGRKVADAFVESACKSTAQIYGGKQSEKYKKDCKLIPKAVTQADEFKKATGSKKHLRKWAKTFFSKRTRQHVLDDEGSESQNGTDEDTSTDKRIDTVQRTQQARRRQKGITPKTCKGYAKTISKNITSFASKHLY